MAQSTAFSVELDKDKIDGILGRVSNNSKYLDDAVQRVVSQYSEPLDAIIKTIDSSLLDFNNPPTLSELEFYSMRLSSCMYFVGAGQEALGIREDVAKAIKLEKYNQCVSQTPGTIRDKESKADLDSQYETVTHSVYARAYRLIKQKMEAASELLASMKKVMNRQLLEAQLSGFTGTGVITEAPSSNDFIKTRTGNIIGVAPRSDTK